MTYLPPGAGRGFALRGLAVWLAYGVLGLLVHLLFYGLPEPDGLWFYVVLVFWPLILLLKFLWLSLMLGGGFLLGFLGYRLYFRWRYGNGGV